MHISYIYIYILYIGKGIHCYTMIRIHEHPSGFCRLSFVSRLEVNILQPSDDVETSAMDCANLRPDGEYLRPEEPLTVITCNHNVITTLEQKSDGRAEASRTDFALEFCQEMDLITRSTRVFARAKPEDMVTLTSHRVLWEHMGTIPTWCLWEELATKTTGGCQPWRLRCWCQ